MAITKKDTHEPEVTDGDVGLEPSSGPRAKGKNDDVTLMIASLRARAQGLEGEELEREITRFLDRVLERNLKIVPERLKEQARELFRSAVEDDPTVRAMIQDLRDGARRG